MNQETIYAQEHTCHSTPPVEAAHILADIWLQNRSANIDLWSRGEFYGQKFYEAFLERVAKVGYFEEARKITWFFDCQTAACSFPNYVEPKIKMAMWTEEFAQKLQRNHESNL